MKEALIWEQGGVKNVLFTKCILSIVSNETVNPRAKVSCEISVDYADEPLNVALPIDEVIRLLEINQE